LARFDVGPFDDLDDLVILTGICERLPVVKDAIRGETLGISAGVMPKFRAKYSMHGRRRKWRSGPGISEAICGAVHRS